MGCFSSKAKENSLPFRCLIEIEFAFSFSFSPQQYSFASSFPTLILFFFIVFSTIEYYQDKCNNQLATFLHAFRFDGCSSDPTGCDEMSDRRIIVHELCRGERKRHRSKTNSVMIFFQLDSSFLTMVFLFLLQSR